MPTIKDVARAAGVSIATVSYVLNNKTESISEQTKQTVLAAAERIGYAPNVTARNLRYSRTRLIGYAWHKIPDPGQSNPMMDQFIYHLAHAAEAANYHLLTFTHPPDDPIPAYDELIRTRRLDAFILSATVPDDERVAMLLKRRFPFATFGRTRPEWDHPWVDVDVAGGIHQAISYFYELGHRQIGLIAWDDETSTTNHRLIGFETAMRGFGLNVPPEYVVQGKPSAKTGQYAMSYWLSLPAEERPTAVLAMSDLEAIGVINIAQDNGLIVGETISVMGFDNIPMSQYLRPPLTTMRQPVQRVAEELVEMIEALLLGRDPRPYRRLLAPTLIERGSCGPPRLN